MSNLAYSPPARNAFPEWIDIGAPIPGNDLDFTVDEFTPCEWLGFTYLFLTGVAVGTRISGVEVLNGSQDGVIGAVEQGQGQGPGVSVRYVYAPGYNRVAGLLNSPLRSAEIPLPILNSGDRIRTVTFAIDATDTFQEIGLWIRRLSEGQASEARRTRVPKGIDFAEVIEVIDER